MGYLITESPYLANLMMFEVFNYEILVFLLKFIKDIFKPLPEWLAVYEEKKGEAEDLGLSFS
jgi:hypothetical protein